MNFKFDPRVKREVRQTRDGRPKVVFVAKGVAHRSYVAALRALGAAR